MQDNKGSTVVSLTCELWFYARQTRTDEQLVSDKTKGLIDNANPEKYWQAISEAIKFDEPSFSPQREIFSRLHNKFFRHAKLNFAYEGILNA